jgi:predicted ABC-type ATPase
VKQTVPLERLQQAQAKTGKPIAVVLAGHNGSGKSTLWREQFAGTFEIPLLNADRLLMSILPETTGSLPGWAAKLRRDPAWMKVSQRGVQDLLAKAQAANLPFAFETVFSHWQPKLDGGFESKVDMLKEMQKAGFFVLLVFVGLPTVDLSIARVAQRVQTGGHDVPTEKLRKRFGLTQQAIKLALDVADASLLFDNGSTKERGFLLCQAQLAKEVLFDIRDQPAPPPEVLLWLDVVAER